MLFHVFHLTRPWLTSRHDLHRHSDLHCPFLTQIQTSKSHITPRSPITHTMLIIASPSQSRSFQKTKRLKVQKSVYQPINRSLQA